MQIVNFSEDVISFTNEFLTFYKNLKEVKKHSSNLFYINIFNSTLYLSNGFYILTQKLEVDGKYEKGISIPEKLINKNTVISINDISEIPLKYISKKDKISFISENITKNDYNRYFQNYKLNKKEFITISKETRNEILEYLEKNLNGYIMEYNYYIKFTLTKNSNEIEIGTDFYHETNQINANLNENYSTATIKMNLLYFYEILKINDSEIIFSKCESNVISINNEIMVTDILNLQENNNFEIDFEQNKTEIKESKPKKPKKPKTMNLKKEIKLAPTKSKYYEPVTEVIETEVIEIENNINKSKEIVKYNAPEVKKEIKQSLKSKQKQVKQIYKELSETVITENFDYIDFIYKSCFTDLENLSFYNTDYKNSRLYLNNCELTFVEIKNKIEVIELDADCNIDIYEVKDKRELLNIVRSKIKAAA